MPQVYFPPLDKCLAGEERLISWKVAYRALGSEDAIESSALEAFLADVKSFGYICDCLDPFGKPSAKSREEFDSKTAPINVSQVGNGGYNLEELKQDALWLSEKLVVAELVALRVVILEWQQRAEDELRTSASSALNGVPSVVAYEENIRRDRQLAIYLEERSFLIRTSTQLVGRVALRHDDFKPASSWIDELANKVTQDHFSRSEPNEPAAFCTRAIGAIDEIFKKLADNTTWPEAFKSSEQNGLVYAASLFSNATAELSLLLAHLSLLQYLPGSQTVLSWFRLMASVKFFHDIIPSVALPDTSSLQCLASIISLVILQLPEVTTLLIDSATSLYPSLPNESYITNDDCIREVNLILYHAAQGAITLASPAVYAWSIITSNIRNIARDRYDQRLLQEEASDDSDAISRRRASRRSTGGELSSFEKQLQVLQDVELDTDARDDPPAFLMRTAVDSMAVLSVVSQLCGSMTTLANGASEDIARGALFDLISCGMPSLSYGAEVLEAILSSISPHSVRKPSKLDQRLAKRFLADEEIMRPQLLGAAIARYPYELSPLMRLLAALADASDPSAISNDIVTLLTNLQTLTVMVPDHFRSYTLENEDENLNEISLTESLPLFVSKQALSYYGRHYLGRAALTTGSYGKGNSNVLSIPTRAQGVVLKESRPLIIKLEHEHSGLSYLGLLLSTFQSNSELVAAPVDDALDRSTGAEIITLIATLMGRSSAKQLDVNEAQFVLDQLSSALQDELDITTVITDILEVQLLAFLDQSTQAGSLELVVACVEFLGKLTQIAPERVWSLLSRSSLLGLSGGSNAIVAVVAGIEVNLGRYKFLSACVSMYENLIADAIAGLVKRKARVNRVNKRFHSPVDSQDHTPERTMSTVLKAYQAVVIDAWQSLPEWRFEDPFEKSNIALSILKTSDDLLKSTYGIESSEKGISALLWPSADAMLVAFAPESGNGTFVQSFCALLADGMAADDDQLPHDQRASLTRSTNAALDFLTTLLRTLKFTDSTAKRASMVSIRLLTAMPVFASLLSAYCYKRSLSALLTEIVLAIDLPDTDPPSLLGQLSTGAAKSFLAVIASLDRPLQNLEVEGSIWGLLSTVLACKQRWFAIYLLTGTIPKDKGKNKTDTGNATKHRSLLVYALDQLSNLSTLAPERATAMLKFVASAQNSWIWATNEVRSHADFLKNTLQWMNDLQFPTRVPNIAEEVILANEHQMAAYLCDILATNLSASNETGDKTVLKMLSSKLTFLTQHAVSVNAYKRSLHLNLSENFSRKFSACDVDDFKKTPVNLAAFGRMYVYDLELADKVLGHERAWQGAQYGKNQGFSDELARANVNLSLVEAQTRLLRSWRVLCTALCECIDNDSGLQGELAKTAESCLTANVDSNLEQPGMDDVIQTRAEMAFVIISKLVSMRTTDTIMKQLLSSIWNLVASSPADYDIATAPEDLTYYRTLLQVLYLAIQPHAYTKSESPNRKPDSKPTDETKIEYLDPSVAACLVQVVSKVITPGFRALCGNLHTSIEMAQPGDFALLTALLQAILSVPGISAVHHQLAEIIVSTSTIRGALSLYSWSDQLAEVMDRDTIYGEIAIMFLLSLSTIPPVAEQMALEGILLQLSSANLSNYYRKPGGKTPFSEPKRMFTIWTEGFLPLCLNLLDAVGPPVAGEVSSFLNSFPAQLQRANIALENREATRQNPHAGAITLNLVSEAHSLCVISLILKSDTARGAAEGIDANEVPQLDYETDKVKEDAAGLMRQRTSLASRIVPTGDKEERWSGKGVAGDNVLLQKIVGEVKGLLRWFGRDE